MNFSLTPSFRRNLLPIFACVAVLLFSARQAGAYIDATLQMQLGNPSNATNDSSNHDHYLITRTVEALDYSDNLGEPVWASWDLTSGDVGNSGRSGSYFTDTTLPAGFYRVTDNDYNGVGNINFNRGHMCPSEDRTDNTADNDLVFYMSNIIPQAANNNQGVWGNFEAYCRSLANSGNELLIICGPSGFGTNRIPSGKAAIADYTWKIAVVVPLGSSNAVTRITTATRVIALKIPNNNSVSSAWSNYVTSASQIEVDTGFTFFTALSPSIASVLRSKVDGQSTPPPSITGFSPPSGNVASSVVITGTNFTTASAVTFNGVSAAFTVNTATQITATVPANATSGLISVTAAGGTALSVTSFVVTGGAIDLTLTATHTGNFTQGDAADTYSITAANVGSLPTSGTITVADVLPAGLIATDINGTGWTGDLGTLTATRTDVLPAGASFPVITVTFSVASNAPSIVTNVATVSGGGDANSVNNSANDPTTIIPLNTGGGGAPMTVVAQWNFNNTNSNVYSPAPLIGTGTASLVGGTTPAYVSGTGSTDTGTPNEAWNTTTYAAQGAGDKTRGVQFAVSTAGYQNISVTWDERLSNTANKYSMLQYTIDGVNYLDFGPVTEMATTTFESKTNYLGNISGINNNPNFAIRILSIFENTAINNGNQNYVAVNTGSTYGTAGTIRFDMLTIYGDPASSSVAPSISSQPQNITTVAGSNVTFSVTAAGTAPLSYQWLLNNVTALPNATNSSLTLNAVTTNQSGLYSVVVSNSAGSITSTNATLAVYPTAAPTLATPTRTGGQLHVTLTGVPGWNYVLLGSTNLSSWTPLATNASPFTYLETNNLPRRFYRGQYQP